MKKVKITRLKNNDKKQRVVKISKCGKSNMRKVNVYTLKPFYDKYMQGIPIPHATYVWQLCNNISSAYYYMDLATMSNEKKHQIIKNFLRPDIINKFYNIFADTSYGKLQHLNILNVMYSSAKLLLEILRYLKESGVKIKMDFTLLELSEAIYIKSFFIANNKEYIRKHRTLVIYDKHIIDQYGKEVYPNKIWKGASIMLELEHNQWVNVPYNYYKRLFNLQKVTFNTVVTIDDNPEDYGLINKTKTVSTVKDILSYILNYRKLWDAFNLVNGTEYLNIWESKNEATVTKKNDEVEVLSMSEFFSKYCEFLMD